MKKSIRPNFALFTLIILTTLATFDSVHGDIVLGDIDRGHYTDTGQHTPTNVNYAVGAFGQTFRNFFVFDLTSINEPILSAKFRANNPLYFSPDPSETYEMFDVTSSLTSLTNGTGGLAAYGDLGSGTPYGSVIVEMNDSSPFVEVELNAAAISALNNSNGLFGFGGRLLDVNTLNEGIFAGSDGTSSGVLRLVTAVPEPSSSITGLIGLLGFVLPRRKRP